MGFAVYHSEKGSVSSGGIGNHIDRIKGMEHTYTHADPSRSHLNEDLLNNNKYSKMPLHQAISERIEKGYKGDRKLRKDAVKYVTHILTGSHKEMIDIFKDNDKTNDWLSANYDFLKEEFGYENIVRLTLHLDEKTPHIHAVTVPITNEGKLSAKEVIGNRKDMQDRQDRYAAHMKPFGLQRGLKRTGIKHEDASTYNSRIMKAQNEVNLEVAAPSKNVLGVYKDNSVIEMQNALKSSRLALGDLQEKLKKEKIKSKSTEAASEKTYNRLVQKSKEVIQLKKNTAQHQIAVNNYLVELATKPEKFLALRNEVQSKLKKIEKPAAEIKTEVKNEVKKGRGRGGYSL